MYAQHLASASELDVVVRGHMAILLGLLMDRAPGNQRILLDALPGSSDREKLGVLIQHAQDFTMFYVTLTRKMAQAQSYVHDEDSDAEEVEAEAGSGDTLATRVLRDSKGEAVARSVIAFLGRLRDQGG